MSFKCEIGSALEAAAAKESQQQVSFIQKSRFFNGKIKILQWRNDDSSIEYGGSPI